MHYPTPIELHVPGLLFMLSRSKAIVAIVTSCIIFFLFSYIGGEKNN